MTRNSGHQTPDWTAHLIRSLSARTRSASISILALLALLLCGLTASIHAQTVSFSGSTTVFDSSHFVAAEGITTDASGSLFIAATPDHSTWNVYKLQVVTSGEAHRHDRITAPLSGNVR